MNEDAETRERAQALPAREQRARRRPPRVCMHAMVPLWRDVRAQRVGAALAAAGYDVTLVDMDHELRPITAPGLERVRVRHIKLPRWTAGLYSPTHPVRWLLFKVMRWARGVGVVVGTRADVYHASDLAALPACYLAARLRRKPLIYEAYELPLVQRHLVRRRMLHRQASRFLRRVVPRCAGVIAVSPPIAVEMHQRFGGPLPLVLRNIPPYQPAITSNRLREHLGLGPAIRIALYQGGIQEDRGLDALVQAGKYLPEDVVIAIMGHGPTAPHLRQVIAEEGIGERVRMIPSVPYAELLSWTASADIGLSLQPPDFSLSIKMSLPNKVFEYLMAGLPVLASPLEAIEEILRSYGAGRIVSSLAPPDIARAIAEMLADPAALAQMHQHALAAARADLHWEAEQHRLLDFYAGLLEPKTPAPRLAPPGAVAAKRSS